VQSAHGAVNEERFSGLRRTPNKHQIQWTILNMARDRDPDVDLNKLMQAENPSDIPDYFIYDQSKAGVSMETLVKMLHLTEKEIKERISKHIELIAQYEDRKKQIDKEMAQEYKRKRNSIG